MSVVVVLILSVVARVLPLVEPQWVPSPPRVTLAQVQERPERYLGKEIQLVLQVKGQRESWEGFTTRFQDSGYVSLAVWSDEELLWVKGDFARSFRHLFVSRKNPWSGCLVRLKTHDRILVNCVVREHLVGQPWIEVSRVLRLREFIPEGTILHAIRAAKCIDRNALRLAAGELARALAAPLPPRQRSVLAAVLADCQEIRERLAQGWRPTGDELERHRNGLIKNLHQVDALEYYSRPVSRPSLKPDSP